MNNGITLQGKTSETDSAQYNLQLCCSSHILQVLTHAICQDSFKSYCGVLLTIHRKGKIDDFTFQANTCNLILLFSSPKMGVWSFRYKVASIQVVSIQTKVILIHTINHFDTHLKSIRYNLEVIFVGPRRKVN